jgi:hypothetical protein
MSLSANQAAKARKARRDAGVVLIGRRSAQQAEILEHAIAVSRVPFDEASRGIASSSLERLRPSASSAQKPKP